MGAKIEVVPFACRKDTTSAALAFYVLGAAILHAKQLDVTNADMIPTLAHMYQETVSFRQARVNRPSCPR